MALAVMRRRVLGVAATRGGLGVGPLEDRSRALDVGIRLQQKGGIIMSDTSTIKRQLTIKTGVVKRLAKEEQSYVTEAQQQEQRIAAFIDAGRDEYDVKQQRTVLEDTQKMIPDCRKRLELALDDLGSFLEGLAEPSITNTPEYSAAKQTLASTQTQLESLPSA